MKAGENIIKDTGIEVDLWIFISIGGTPEYKGGTLLNTFVYYLI